MKNEMIISKMLTYMKKVSIYTRDMTYKDFIENEMVLEACVFNLSQL